MADHLDPGGRCPRSGAGPRPREMAQPACRARPRRQSPVAGTGQPGRGQRLRRRTRGRPRACGLDGSGRRDRRALVAFLDRRRLGGGDRPRHGRVLRSRRVPLDRPVHHGTCHRLRDRLDRHRPDGPPARGADAGRRRRVCRFGGMTCPAQRRRRSLMRD